MDVMTETIFQANKIMAERVASWIYDFLLQNATVEPDESENGIIKELSSIDDDIIRFINPIVDKIIPIIEKYQSKIFSLRFNRESEGDEIDEEGRERLRSVLDEKKKEMVSVIAAFIMREKS